MTREIKLRAWDDVAKKMYYGEAEQFDDMLGFRFRHFATEKPFYMQSTGIKDSEENEIYEGDLLERWGGVFEVKFGDYYNGMSFEDAIAGNGWYIEKRKGDNFCPYIDDLTEGREYKIIGDIYKNPELLTVY